MQFIVIVYTIAPRLFDLPLREKILNDLFYNWRLLSPPIYYYYYYHTIRQKEEENTKAIDAIYAKKTNSKIEEKKGRYARIVAEMKARRNQDTKTTTTTIKVAPKLNTTQHKILPM